MSMIRRVNRGLPLLWLLISLRVISGELPAGEGGWVTLNRGFDAQRFVDLDQINKRNLDRLKPICEAKLNEPAWFGSGIIQIGRSLFVTTLKATYAIDAVTCKPLWRAPVPFKNEIASYFATRGVGYLNGVLYRGTNDGQLLALDAATGKRLWSVQAADPSQCESLVAAPVAWNDRLFIGVATSDKGIDGRLMAFDARTGQELWRFKTVQMNNEKGGGFWTTVSLDAHTGEVIAPVSNPTPIFYPEDRPGDNLYTNAVISVDAATGKLNWHYQAIPRDEHDWDLSAAPTLYQSGEGRALLAVTGKSGRVYGYDRTTQAKLLEVPATTLAHDDEPLGSEWKWVCPGAGAQYNGTAYHPGLHSLFVGMADWCRFFRSTPPTSDSDYAGGSTTPDYSTLPEGRITALAAESGEIRWRYQNDAPFVAGLVTTRAGLLFAGDLKGRLMAFDAASGALQRRQDLGGALNNGLISYAVDNRQYLAAAVGGSSISTAGVAGPLRVTVLGLSDRKKPIRTAFSRIDPALGSIPAPKALFLTVCSNCHGSSGSGALYPSILRHTQLANPKRLRQFLATVPDPMPKLYPGLLKPEEVRQIADYLRTDLFKCGQPEGADCQPPGRPQSGGSREWRQLYAVFTHPRCLNCHTASDPVDPATRDYPRQADDRHPHLFGISRGTDDKGLLNGRCASCHGRSNNPQTGAPGVDEAGESGWFLAPSNMSMEASPGVAMSGATLCTQLKNPETNGGFTLAGLLEHLENDGRVNWAWEPGLNSNGVERTRPPISHERFVDTFAAWTKKGAPCPKAAP